MISVHYLLDLLAIILINFVIIDSLLPEETHRHYGSIESENETSVKFGLRRSSVSITVEVLLTFFIH